VRIAIKSLSQFVAFLRELAVLTAVGYWGFKTGSPGYQAGRRARHTGPVRRSLRCHRRPRRTPGPARPDRAILEICWFGGGVAALAAGAATLPAIVLSAAYLPTPHLWLTANTCASAGMQVASAGSPPRELISPITDITWKVGLMSTPFPSHHVVLVGQPDAEVVGGRR
jgi:hypothetical protein